MSTRVAMAMMIKVQRNCSDPIEIKIRQDTTVVELKLKLQEQFSTWVKNQILKFAGDELKDEKKLIDYSITDDSLIQLEEKQTQFFLKDLNGKTQVFHMLASETVLSLKQQIFQNLKIPIIEQRLMTGTKQLKDDNTLFDSGVQNDTTVWLLLRLRGGSAKTNSPFVMKEEQFDDDAPAYREVIRGLSVEGKCTNNSCEAHNKKVICYQGFVEFNLLDTKAKCPICTSEVVADKPGFFNCIYKIQSQKPNGEKFWTHWLLTPDRYITFDEAKTTRQQFSKLTAQAIKKDDVLGGGLICPICLLELLKTDPVTQKVTAPDEIRILDCSHPFHKSCITQWTLTGANKCPNCRHMINPNANEQEAQILQAQGQYLVEKQEQSRGGNSS
ncbi:MAG: putative ring and ubiquitin domain containing protein [Streblomastix strix]|uniref:Putative ring and ubiquitin domain containing protein n=1 Tax=Streblomastix strix TaxID=222440 RepID=A0A5J4W6B8_9EUKA|nr:MAG: putative ring and ubiquitin domain containing protein [Streblomastix strix]